MRCVLLLISIQVISFPLKLVANDTAPSPAEVATSMTSNEPYDPDRLEATDLLTGLERPMELEVAPDGSVYWIELAGLLKCYHPATDQTSIVGELTVTTEQENGLIGMALDPNFAINQRIFLQYSPPDYPGQHISRFTLRDRKLDLNSEKVLVKFEEQRQECCHHAGSMQFGPDGNLFIGTGDNTHPGGDSEGYAPLDERPGRGPYDAQKSAGNTASLSGKILRIRPTEAGGYEIPEGNLFPPDGSGGRPEIYVMGCRNPWRVSVDQRSGFVYWGDVGPDAGSENERGPRGYDEINQARQAGNFGWPYFIANNQAYAEFDFLSGEIGSRYDPARPINRSPNSHGAAILPAAQEAFIYYPYAASEQFPELGGGGRTACAGPVYYFDPKLASNVKLPSKFDSTLFIFDWSRHWIKAVHLDSDGKIKSIEPFMAARGFQRPIDLEHGPDGAMYLIEYGETWGVNTNSKLVRIQYVRGNRTPVAVARVTNGVGREPLEVRFSSEGSFDKDHDELNFEWTRFDSQQPDAGGMVISSEPNPAITFQEPGVYHVVLTVRDSHGATATASVAVVVGNAPPSVTIRQPTSGFLEADKPIRFEIVVQDFEDGTNDSELIDVHDIPVIDGDAPLRVAMQARPAPSDSSHDDLNAPVGLKLIKASDCLNCHDLHEKRVGPPYIEVAKKYRDVPDAAEASVTRVLEGSTGVWGKIPMIPHKQHTREQVRSMVEWIFGLQEQTGAQLVRGFVGNIDSHPEYAHGVLLLATYTDRGLGIVPPITTTATMRLRSRLLEAEQANRIEGPTEMRDEGGTQFVGSINHGHFLMFENIDWKSVARITARVSTGGPGGEIEFRQGSQTGRLIGTVHVPAGHHWGDWKSYSVGLYPLQEQATAVGDDLYVLFVSDQKRDAIMNLDSLFLHGNDDQVPSDQ